MYDVVLCVEKSRYVRQDIASMFMRQFASRLSEKAFSRLGLVVYCRYAVPLMDLSYNYSRLIESYETIPSLRGIPEPALGLYEAAEMIMDMDDGLAEERAIVLIGSFDVKPRKPLPDAIGFVRAAGIRIYMLSTSPRKPGWLSKEALGDIMILRQSSVDKCVRAIINSLTKGKV